MRKRKRPKKLQYGISYIKSECGEELQERLNNVQVDNFIEALKTVNTKLPDGFQIRDISRAIVAALDTNNWIHPTYQQGDCYLSLYTKTFSDRMRHKLSKLVNDDILERNEQFYTVKISLENLDDAVQNSISFPTESLMPNSEDPSESNEVIPAKNNSLITEDKLSYNFRASTVNTRHNFFQSDPEVGGLMKLMEQRELATECKKLKENAINALESFSTKKRRMG